MKYVKRETGSYTDGKRKRKLPSLGPWRRAVLYLLSVLAAIAAICQAAIAPLPDAAAYFVYVAAFMLLCVSGIYLQRDIRGLRRNVVLPLIESNSLTRKAYRDYGYRTLLTAGLGTAVNLAFTVGNGLWGFWNHSVWFVTVAVYYSLLGGMRFFSIRSKRRADRDDDRGKALQKEIAVMKRDGVLLLLMTVALGGMVFLKIAKGMVTPYSSVFAIATAAYTFYKIIFVVRNMLKVRGLGSPILTAVRNIAFADALVSMFSLQVLLFVSFDQEGSGAYDKLMNSLTGLAVCMAVIFMGIRMARASGYRKKGGHDGDIKDKGQW